jgi:uncharacterized phage-associated protein
MTPQSPFAVANYFIRKAGETGKSLTPMKLIKMVYIAHGWCLGLTGEPLITEKIQAWKYGPLIESLYRVFRKYGSSNIPESGQVPDAPLEDSEVLRRFLDRVWAGYSGYSGLQLSTLTHQKDTPWSKVYTPLSFRKIIPDEEIKQHYRGKLNAVREREALDSAAKSTRR